MGRLDGRVAIVTGAGRGIGRAVATLLASEGASVVVNDLGAALDGSGSDAGPAGQVVEEIAAAGGKAIANGADVSDHAAAQSLIGSAIEQFGRLDVLVNVAGILRDRMVFNMTEQEWDDVIRVHLRGTFNTTKFAAAHWRSIRDPRGAEPDHQLHLGLRPAWRAGPAQLRGSEDGHRRSHLLVRERAARLRRDGQRDLAWRGDTDDRVGAYANVAGHARVRTSGPLTTSRRWSPTSRASSRAGSHGRIVHSSGYEIALYSNPEPEIRIIGTGPWDADSLASQMERSFGPKLGRKAWR